MTTDRLVSVSLSRFVHLPRPVWRIIGRLHDWPAHYTAATLLVGGKPRRPKAPGEVLRVRRSVLQRAEVRLTYGLADDPLGKVSPYSAVVPYGATGAELRAGWMEVAFLVGCSVARDLDAYLRWCERDVRRAFRLCGLNSKGEPKRRR